MPLQKCCVCACLPATCSILVDMLIFLCAHGCVCVYVCVWGFVCACRSPAPLLSICMCRVLRDVGSALPGGHLNFSPRRVLHYTRLRRVKSARLHPLLLSVPSLFIYLPRPRRLLSQLPPTPCHTHTCSLARSRTRLIKARSSLD